MKDQPPSSSAILSARLPDTPSEDDDRVLRRFAQNTVSSHGGRILDSEQQELVAEFSQSLPAINCALAIQSGLRALLPGLTEHTDGARIAISLGPVDKEDTATEAARSFWGTAQPAEIVVSQEVYDASKAHVDSSFSQVKRKSTAGKDAQVYRLDGVATAEQETGFFAELLRRRIFRAAGAYILVSWMLVQVASIFFPEFDAPRWAMRALIIMLVAGFPPAMLLAWTVDISTSGFVRTADSPYSRVKGNTLRFSLVAVASLIAAATLWWVWTGFIEPSTERPGRTAGIELPVIAVNPPRKTAGSSELDWLGEGIADLLRNQIAESNAVIVVSASRWNEIAMGAESAIELVTAARDAGIDYLIDGSFLQTSSDIRMSLEIEDVAAGTAISAGTVSGNDSSGIVRATGELSLGIKRALNIPFETNVEQLAADFVAQNMEAYEAYVAGLGYFISFNYQEAEQLFRAALDLAPDYHMARFRLAHVLESTGRADQAYAELNRIPDNGGLTERERLYVEGAKASFTAGQDPARAIEIYDELLTKYPYEMEAGQHLAEAYWLDYQDDAAIEIFRKLTDVHAHSPAAWIGLGERLIEVGQLEEAKTALNKSAEMAPGDAFAVALLGNVALLEGDITASIRRFEQSLVLHPDFEVATIGLARSHFLQGDIATAEQLLRDLQQNDSASARYRIDAVFDLVGMLRGQGRFESASETLESVEEMIREEELRAPWMLSLIGENQFELGVPDRPLDFLQQAIVMAEELNFPTTRYLFARGMIELRAGSLDALQATIVAVSSANLSSEGPSDTELAAAAYLQGLAFLNEGDIDSARESFDFVATSSGYAYSIYEAGFARFHRAIGDLDSALEYAEQAIAAREAGDLRLDLELDRTRAQLLYAEILHDAGRESEAAEQARRFIDRWKFTSDRSTDLQRAQALLPQ